MAKCPTWPDGFLSWGGNCGIKNRKPDFGILYCPSACASAAIFTTCKVKAPPVELGIKQGAKKLKAIVVNSGNANACTGKKGMNDAISTQRQLAKQLNINPTEVLVSSTGKIGEVLDMDAIQRGISKGIQGLNNPKFLKANQSVEKFSQAILTTDLVKKFANVEFKVGDKKAKLTGVSKGSGMIEPNMATMLAYVTTDINIGSAMLKSCLKVATEQSFNAITVDGHMSTNDTVAIIASGKGPKITKQNVNTFQKALNKICLDLALQIVKDGEGATKFVTIDIQKAKNKTDAKKIAKAIANSALVKTAIHGSDPNWGRIISAAGYSSNYFNPDKSKLKLNGVTVFAKGLPLEKNTTKANKVMKKKDIHIELVCNTGSADTTAYTCDLSREYIRINADYHT